MMLTLDTYRKYKEYDLQVESTPQEKAIEFKLYSCAAPHMKNLHVIWMSFFLANITWFGLSTVSKDSQKSLSLKSSDMDDIQIYTNISLIAVRIISGYLCDIYGPRLTQIFLVTVSVIPLFFSYIISSLENYILLRIVNITAGGTLTVAIYWTILNFSENTIGTALGVVTGWGRLGSIIFQIVCSKILLSTNNNDPLWKLVMIVIGIGVFLLNLIVSLVGEDTPKGNLSELIRLGLVGRKMVYYITKKALVKTEVWVLCLISCFVYSYDTYFTTILDLYIRSEFKIAPDESRSYATFVGLTNIISRIIGGSLSDYFSRSHYVGGRTQFLFITMFLQGLLLVIFSQINNFTLSYMFVIAIVFVANMSQVSIAAILPYIDKNAVGVVCGIVTSGGMIGSMFIILLKNILNELQQVYLYFGMITLGACFSCALIIMEKQSSSLVYIMFFAFLGFICFLQIIVIYLKIII